MIDQAPLGDPNLMGTASAVDASAAKEAKRALGLLSSLIAMAIAGMLGAVVGTPLSDTIYKNEPLPRQFLPVMMVFGSVVSTLFVYARVSNLGWSKSAKAAYAFVVGTLVFGVGLALVIMSVLATAVDLTRLDLPPEGLVIVHSLGEVMHNTTFDVGAIEAGACTELRFTLVDQHDNVGRGGLPVTVDKALNATVEVAHQPVPRFDVSLNAGIKEFVVKVKPDSTVQFSFELTVAAEVNSKASGSPVRRPFRAIITGHGTRVE